MEKIGRRMRFTEEEAAIFCGFALSTFRRLRYERKGPRNMLGGKGALYWQEDCTEWLEKRGSRGDEL